MIEQPTFPLVKIKPNIWNLPVNALQISTMHMGPVSLHLKPFFVSVYSYFSYHNSSYNLHVRNQLFSRTNTPPAPTKRIMSLQSPTQKMSKSHPSPISRILLTDSPDTITKKISSALTDSQNAVSYSPSERPGVSNLLTLWSSFDTQNPKRTPAQIAEECKAKKFTLGDLKRETANAVNTGLEPIRKNYERLLGDEGYVEDVARKGGVKARENAERTMVEVREAVGF